MKLSELEDGHIVATKEDLREVRLDIREVKLDVRDLRTQMNEQFQRIKLLVWLPAIALIVQLIAGVILKAWHLI